MLRCLSDDKVPLHELSYTYSRGDQKPSLIIKYKLGQSSRKGPTASLNIPAFKYFSRMAVSQASKNNSDSQLQNSPFIAVLFIQDSSTSTYNIYSLLIASPANEPRNEPSLIPNIIIIIPQSDADDDVAHHKCTQIMPTIKAAELQNTKPPTHIFNILFFYKTDSLILCVTLNLASESQFIDFLPHPNFTLPLEYFISFPQLFL